MNYRQKVGQFGEEIAKKYLVKHGYKIIASNIQTSHKEIDIIAKFKDLLVFIEVKTRTSNKYGEADEGMSSRKIKNFKYAIKRYLCDSNNKIYYKDIRADLIAVDVDRNKKIAKIKHYKDII
ncbi:YraN family protein [Candidatus Parcubacteria bacterium]|nr:YraN family protein [Candidatus Parcubacteria bacterium]